MDFVDQDSAASVPEPPATGSATPRASLSELDGLDALDDVTFGALHVLCRALHVDDAHLDGTLHAILTSATEAVPAADHAGLNLMLRGSFEPQATVGVAPPRLDALQQRTGAGPCIDSSREQVTMEVTDMRRETRWPDFARAAVDLGVYAMLCVPLWVDERRLGSLSLYAGTPRAFDGNATRMAELYATHAALALLDAQRVEQMRRAIESRDVIGQAKGVLMCRHNVTADQAFQLLRNASQASNRKLVDVAESVAATGELPNHG